MTLKQNYRKNIPDYFIAIVVGIIGILFFGVYLRILFRGGGILGVILAVLAGGLLAYWLKEATQLFKIKTKTHSKQKWDVDVFEDSKNITIVARIPNPCEKVAVFLKGRVLQVKGERDLKLDIPLKEDVKISGSTYKNRVLQVTLRKLINKN
jgi:hypothetical protein